MMASKSHPFSADPCRRKFAGHYIIWGVYMASFVGIIKKDTRSSDSSV